MTTEQKTCFVIMPFSKTTDEHTEEYWTNHFEVFLKPLIEANGQILARRSQPIRGDILNQIITDLIRSPLVVADLTDKNANVFWELGVRQSFKHGTITIAEIDTILPFDVSTKSTLYYYPKNIIRNEGFRQNFQNALNDCLTNPHDVDSRVLEIVNGRGTLFEIYRRDEIIRRLDAVIAEVQLNIETLDKSKDEAQSFEKQSNEPVFSLLQFRTSALDLMVTERYIEGTESFYSSLEVTLRQLSGINLIFQDLNMRANTMTPEWILRFYPVVKNQLETICEGLIKLRATLIMKG